MQTREHGWPQLALAEQERQLKRKPVREDLSTNPLSTAPSPFLIPRHLHKHCSSPSLSPICNRNTLFYILTIFGRPIKIINGLRHGLSAGNTSYQHYTYLSNHPSEIHVKKVSPCRTEIKILYHAAITMQQNGIRRRIGEDGRGEERK